MKVFLKYLFIYLFIFWSLLSPIAACEIAVVTD